MLVAASTQLCDELAGPHRRTDAHRKPSERSADTETERRFYDGSGSAGESPHAGAARGEDLFEAHRPDHLLWRLLGAAPEHGDAHAKDPETVVLLHVIHHPDSASRWKVHGGSGATSREVGHQASEKGVALGLSH